MKRRPVIRRIVSSLSDNDVAIFSNSLRNEAFENDREGNFYMLGSSHVAGSFGLGLAMGTNKRVFVFITDNELLRNFSVAAQIAASRCRNIFYIVLHSGRFQSSGYQHNIFRNIRAPKGLLFNLGFLVHDYTSYFKSKNSGEMMVKLIERLMGPLAILIEIDYGISKNLDDISYSEIELKNRLINFVANDGLGTSIYTPPAFAGHEVRLNNKEE